MEGEAAVETSACGSGAEDAFEPKRLRKIDDEPEGRGAPATCASTYAALMGDESMPLYASTWPDADTSLDCLPNVLTCTGVAFADAVEASVLSGS